MSKFTREKLAAIAETEAKKGLAWEMGAEATKYTKAFEPDFGTARFEWCGAFVHWCVEQAAETTIDTRFTDIFGFTWALVEGIQQWAEENQIYIDNMAGVIPKPGDLVIFDWNQQDIDAPDIDWDSHVGIFLRMDGEHYVCAEGNTGNVTAIKSRPQICIQGFIRIPDNFDFEKKTQTHKAPTMSNFNKAFDWVIGNEGGFSNDPNDAGGATNWGITHDELASWRGHPVSIDDVKNLGIDEAKLIYKKKYWDAMACDSIQSDAIAIALFDQGVNCGVGAASKRAQSVVGTYQDGQIGPITLAAINAETENKFIPAFAKATLEYYAAIVGRNPSQSVFILGWVRRGCKLLDLIAA